MLPQSDQSEAANIVYFYDIVYFKSNIRRVSKLADFELVFFVLWIFCLNITHSVKKKTKNEENNQIQASYPYHVLFESKLKASRKCQHFSDSDDVGINC